jgi:hypothetical protein
MFWSPRKNIVDEVDWLRDAVRWKHTKNLCVPDARKRKTNQTATPSVEDEPSLNK